MVLDGQLAVGLLDLGSRAGGLDAEDAIVVRVGRAGWHRTSSERAHTPLPRREVMRVGGNRADFKLLENSPNKCPRGVGLSVQAPPSLLCGKLPRFDRAHGRIEACGADVEANKGTTPHVAPEGVLVVDRHAWIAKRGEISVYGGASERPRATRRAPSPSTAAATLQRRGRAAGRPAQQRGRLEPCVWGRGSPPARGRIRPSP